MHFKFCSEVFKNKDYLAKNKGGPMETYLAIITTALVLTQIIRVMQNARQLRHMQDIQDKNQLITRVYTKLERWLDDRE